MSRFIALSSVIFISIIAVSHAKLILKVHSSCTREKMREIGTCVLNNTRHFETVEIEGFEGEDLQRMKWIYTCYENLKCFKGWEQCDFMESIADRRTCENMELAMKPGFKECMEKMRQVTNNKCVEKFMFVFETPARKSSSRKLSCPIYKRFCVEGYIAENCAAGVVDDFKSIMEHLIRVKKCDYL